MLPTTTTHRDLAAARVWADRLIARKRDLITPLSERDQLFFRERVANHEAAHAIVAGALGLSVPEITVRPDGTGWTEITGGTIEAQRAVYAAGDLWIEYLADQRFAGSYACSASDQAWLIENGCMDEHNMQVARTQAMDILRTHQRQVLDLAERLTTRTHLIKNYA